MQLIEPVSSAMRVRFNRPQSLTHQAIGPSRTVALPWGRGVGKSWFLLRAIYLDIAQRDGVLRSDALDPFYGVRWVLMLPTFKQAKDLYAKPLEDDLTGSGEWAWLGGSIHKTSWRIAFPGGSWIQLFGAEKAQATRGLRVDGLALDECDDIDTGTYDSVIAPWFSEPWSLKQRIVGGTPRRGRFGLLYRTHRRGSSPNARERRDNHFSVHATGYDVPENVDREYLEEQKRDTPKEIFEREYLCNFDSAEGLVYGFFDERFHVREPEPDTVWSEIICGVDHGFENAGVFQAIGVAGTGRDARLHVIDEVYQTQRTEQWWIRAAQEWHEKYPDAKWYADPSNPARIKALKTEAGLRIVGADNRKHEGVEAVADKLVKRVIGPTGDPWSRLYIHPKCENTIREFGLYRRKRDPKNPEAVIDEIEDRNNHAMDAMRYAVFGRFGGPDRGRIEQADTDYSWG